MAVAPIIESRLGTIQMTWHCAHLDGRSVLTGVLTEQFMTVISQCSEIAFSIASDASGVDHFHFSLDGAYEAITAALEAASHFLPDDTDGPSPAAPDPGI